MTTEARSAMKARKAHESAESDSTAHHDKSAAPGPSTASDGGKEVLVVPQQAMAAGLGPRQASETDTEEGDVPMPWWYTPRRLLVNFPCKHSSCTDILTDGKQHDWCAYLLSFKGAPLSMFFPHLALQAP